MARSLLISDGFYPGARALRKHFDERFGDPRSASGGRFIWDYWHVPDQYTLLRTPAYGFFPPALYEAFHRHLVAWGRETLGCHDISPPWLSCYVEGCGQELHGDLPHGPWAFVYSITGWERRRFRGGETLILKDPILDYWREFRSGRAVENEEIYTRVPARFNRLVTFDPRVPHGVSRIEGAVRDVREGRLVVHGWFVQPRPFIRGSLSVKSLQNAIGGLSERLAPWLERGIAPNGVVSLRFKVGGGGVVSGIEALTDTIRCPDPRDARILRSEVRKYLEGVRFGRQRGISSVTLPLVFETG